MAKEPAVIICTYDYLTEVCADLFDVPPTPSEFVFKFYKQWGVFMATHLNQICEATLVRKNAEILCSFGDNIDNLTLVDMEKQGFVAVRKGA